MAKSFCCWLILVNHALIGIFNDANMALNAIPENKILAKISEFTVTFIGEILSNKKFIYNKYLINSLVLIWFHHILEIIPSLPLIQTRPLSWYELTLHAG